LGADLTVNELILRFWRHVESHYRHADGTPTAEQDNFRLSLKPLKELYGHSLAANFGPLALKTVRKKMIDAKLTRSLINQRISRVKRLFKWAVAEELVPASVHYGLIAVEGLKAGRTEAKDRPQVQPVAEEHIEAVLPKLNRHVRGMVQVQRLTGMRPGEVCTLKRSEIDMSSAIWFYRPSQHKTAWRGKERLIAIGPRAQEILKEFFTPNTDDYLFSPRRMMAERAVEMRAKRKTNVQPSQKCRRKTKPKRSLGERYCRQAYVYAIRRACHKVGIRPSWHPNQLRHSFGTECRKRFGLEAAQVGLGHAKADITQIYAERNVALAAHVAAEVG